MPNDSNSTQRSDEEIEILVLAAQDGDKEAFSELYDHFFDAIYRYVYFRVNQSEVDDIVETVFVKTWMNLEQYEKRDVKFSSWLFRIAHNAVIDFRRSHRSLEALPATLVDESDSNAPKAQTEKIIMGKKVRDAVSKLKEPYRQVITLKFLSGLSNDEIAEILGEREGNVRVLQFRALKQLKRHLADTGFTYKNL